MPFKFVCALIRTRLTYCMQIILCKKCWYCSLYRALWFLCIDWKLFEAFVLFDGEFTLCYMYSCSTYSVCLLLLWGSFGRVDHCILKVLVFLFFFVFLLMGLAVIFFNNFVYYLESMKLETIYDAVWLNARGISDLAIVIQIIW